MNVIGNLEAEALKATLRAVMGAAQVASSPEDGSGIPGRSSDYSLRR